MFALATIAILTIVYLTHGDGQHKMVLNDSEKAMASNAAMQGHFYQIHRINDTSFYTEEFISIYETDYTNYTIGNIIAVPQDYYCYNASERLVLVPIKNEKTQITTNYTVDLDRNKTISSFTDSDQSYAYQQKMSLIKLALKDPNVTDVITGENMSYTVSVAPISPIDAGYLNVSGNYATVNIVAQYKDVPEKEYLYLTMDATNERMIGFIYSRSALLPRFPQWHIVPPGVSFIHSMVPTSTFGKGYNIIILYTGIYFTPQDAKMYSTIVDEENLTKLKNGSSYKPLTVFDLITNNTIKYDDSQPVHSGWMTGVLFRGKPLNVSSSGTISLSDDTHYYLVIRNAYDREITVTFKEDTSFFQLPQNVSYL